MTDHAPPSADPADDDNLAGVLRATFRKFLQQTDDMLPARVVAFDRDKNRATVVPCIHVLTTKQQQVPRAQIASVPVMQFGGGGIVLNFNLKPGDLGWIHANDRDISMFLQNYASSAPNTLRLHTFQDGVFIPEVMRGWVINGEDSDNAVLQTLNGNARVAVGAAFVKATFGTHSVKLSAAGVEVTSDVKVNILAPSIVMTTGAGKSVTLGAGKTNIVGGLIVDGIDMGLHKHSDPQGGDTGGPHN